MRAILDFIFADANTDFERMACLLIFYFLLEVIASFMGDLIGGVRK
ncbi:MAG: hypothetical protein J1E35_03605 [Lachnospiraceae bacterium]|nr:hypothetical protein [Lachnospiraceae bacterium]